MRDKRYLPTNLKDLKLKKIIGRSIIAIYLASITVTVFTVMAYTYGVIVALFTIAVMALLVIVPYKAAYWAAEGE